MQYAKVRPCPNNMAKIRVKNNEQKKVKQKIMKWLEKNAPKDSGCSSI